MLSLLLHFQLFRGHCPYTAGAGAKGCKVIYMRVVAGSAKGRRLVGPKTPGTRPVMDRVKTALFDILASDIADTRFLDLFAGTGSIGIEALSRGAAFATFIERSPEALRCVQQNL